MASLLVFCCAAGAFLLVYFLVSCLYWSSVGLALLPRWSPVLSRCGFVLLVSKPARCFSALSLAEFFVFQAVSLAGLRAGLCLLFSVLVSCSCPAGWSPIVSAHK